MLETFRRSASNIFVKAFLGLIALSFILWGVGDMFHGTTNTDVAKIGKLSVSRAEFNHDRTLEINRIQNKFNGELTPEQIKTMKLEEVVLNRLVNRKLLALATEKMQLKVGIPGVLNNIQTDPTFLNDNGVFDKVKFNTLLQANNLNEESYLKILRKEMATEFLMGTLAAEKIVPSDLVTRIYHYNMQKRAVQAVLISKNHSFSLPAPKEAELQDFYEAHKNQLLAPELRSISYITLSVDDLLEGITTSDNEALLEYNENIGNYQTPEKRTVDNLLFSTEKEALDAWNALKNAKDFTAKAKEITHQTEKERSLGTIQRTDLPPTAQDSVFSLEKNTLSQPVKSSLGWHIFRVTAIIPAFTTTFEEAKKGIITSLTHKKAEESLANYAKKLEDEFASGATLEEVATKLGLKARKATKITATGNNEAGESSEGLPSFSNFLPQVFSSEEGNDPVLTLSPDNNSYFIIRVDQITAPRIRTFQEAKPQVIEAWKSNQQAAAVKKLAEKIVERLKAGDDALQVAQSERAELFPSQVVSRPDNTLFGTPEGIYPPSLLKEVFTLQKGQVSSLHQTREGDYIIGILQNIIPANPAEDKNGVEQVRFDLGRRFTSDITEQYLRYLRKQYTVKILMIPEMKEQEN